MDFAHAVARILEHLENDKVEAATMACLRVARSAQDHLSAAYFLRELTPRREEVARMLFADAEHLTDEARKYVFERSLDRWLEVHTVTEAFASANIGEERPVLVVAAGEIESDLARWENAIRDLTTPPGLTSADAAAVHRAANAQRAQIRLRLAALETIKARLKTQCLNYAIQIEKQLSLQTQNQEFLWKVQNDVNNYFKEREPDVFQKLQKASMLAASSDPEDAALLLTEVRRALKAAADHFYPPRDGPVTCSDGKERVLGDDRYLNRMNEYLVTRTPSSSVRELAIAELGVLDMFMRRLNDFASKGVHSTVTQAEARQGLVGMFMFLFTITQHAPLLS